MSATGDDVPGVEPVVEAQARALGLEPSTLVPETKVVEVCADSLDLYCLFLTLDEWVPGFRLPRQLDLDLATLADVHHYLVLRAEQRRSR